MILNAVTLLSIKFKNCICCNRLISWFRNLFHIGQRMVQSVLIMYKLSPCSRAKS